ncbi:hypothetical protein FHR72_002812 [Mycolicibacterium iranicum]|uniref:Uncharacterized protein n=1 Tax=Mycolicibacterium iranicum TaxID=912594 RepID=A0A839Q503_MYCIR|nr:hypothetical protein [Mycolicibacterium iranicum]MBB2991328.1 hypothetical protein [Mycolicibacterium iranicum]
MTRAWSALMVAVAVAGCTPDPVDSPFHEIRTDSAPLTTRFPAIGTPVSARWVTWHSEDAAVPGPTTYWIDAVLTLNPQTTATLTGLDPTAQGRTPSVAEALRPEVSDGPFLTGPALDAAMSAHGWTAGAYLDAARNQLVLNAFDD